MCARFFFRRFLFLLFRLAVEVGNGDDHKNGPVTAGVATSRSAPLFCACFLNLHASGLVVIVNPYFNIHVLGGQKLFRSIYARSRFFLSRVESASRGSCARTRPCLPECFLYDAAVVCTYRDKIFQRSHVIYCRSHALLVRYVKVWIPLYSVNPKFWLNFIFVLFCVSCVHQRLSVWDQSSQAFCLNGHYVCVL